MLALSERVVSISVTDAGGSDTTPKVTYADADVTQQLGQRYAQPGHHWLTDEAEHERARTTLATARPTYSPSQTTPPAMCSPPARREAPDVKPASLFTGGFRCECWTHDSATGQGRKLLGSLDVKTAHQTARWIRIATRTIASALDDDAFTETWAWLSDGHQDVLQALTKGEPCTLTVHDNRTTIQWTAHPVRFLKLSTRQGINLPACMEKYAQPQEQRE
ncbi:hypothetical protein [Streptomyces corynorhini]|uniref:Uncharacterized protein n=1 Tax=Streptomyces corynorhini TaxID=2282652 RepID=A0A370BBD6_9ACTN|nr:hypothetical protein [Streptomyces corynorhini]RDG38951.1 hypothetical protein DVH02_06265 [Streptomyces corynorhini]